MTNEFEKDVVGTESVEVETAAKPKRTRKAPIKIQKTAGDIIIEINQLNDDLTELSDALAGLATDNVAYSIVQKAFEAKRDEHEKALSQVYTA